MRLVNVDTLEMKSFGDQPPPYAVLSHRWGDDELSLQDFQAREKRQGPGFEKIRDFCNLLQDFRCPEKGHSARLELRFELQSRTLSDLRTVKKYPTAVDPAKEDLSRLSIDWAWVDTVCIDKTSSSELSEAINSMWRYYAESRVCIAYLGDLVSESPSSLYRSQWFKRGWTLQELLAPADVLFYSQPWRLIGSKRKLAARKHSSLAKASGVDSLYLLNNGWMQSTSVAQRMSWAARRSTTRQEDMAYCLMGLFGVNMPLLYGEGWRKAFFRLQTEIIRQSDDESIFVFDKQAGATISGVFLSHPSAFSHSAFIQKGKLFHRPPYTVTNKGLHIEGPAIRVSSSEYRDLFILKLNCVRWSYSVAVEGDHPRACILAIQRLGAISVLWPEVQKKVLQMTSLEVQELFVSRQWEKLESELFVVALSTETAVSLRDEQERSCQVRFGMDGLWFEGLGGEQKVIIEECIPSRPSTSTKQQWFLEMRKQLRLLP